MDRQPGRRTWQPTRVATASSSSSHAAYPRLLPEKGWGETGCMEMYFTVVKALLAESYDQR